MKKLPDLGTNFIKYKYIKASKYIEYTPNYVLVKTLRIEDEKIHKELLKIQGRIQAKSGEPTKLENVLQELIDCYNKRNPSKRR